MLDLYYCLSFRQDTNECNDYCNEDDGVCTYNYGPCGRGYDKESPNGICVKYCGYGARQYHRPCDSDSLSCDIHCSATKKGLNGIGLVLLIFGGLFSFFVVLLCVPFVDEE